VLLLMKTKTETVQMAPKIAKLSGNEQKLIWGCLCSCKWTKQSVPMTAWLSAKWVKQGSLSYTELLDNGLVSCAMHIQGIQKPCTSRDQITKSILELYRGQWYYILQYSNLCSNNSTGHIWPWQLLWREQVNNTPIIMSIRVPHRSQWHMGMLDTPHLPNKQSKMRNFRCLILVSSAWFAWCYCGIG
jgi:hypothetical protein